MSWLLLRGFTRERRHWGSFPDRLSAAVGAPVACLDAPGFGTEAHRRSPFSLAGITDDIRRRFLAERGDDEWSVLGISLDLDALARQYAAWADERHPHPMSVAGQAVAAITFRLGSEMKVPVLVLASRADRLVSYRCSEQVAKRLGAPLRLHDSGGHDLTLDDPEWVCREIKEWQGTPTIFVHLLDKT